MSSLACDVSSYAAGSRNPTEMRPCSPVRMKPLMNFNCHTSNPITDDVEMNETVMCPFFASQLTLAFPCRNQRFEQLRPISCYVQLLRFKELTFGRKGADSFRPMLHRLASKRLTKCIAKTYFDFATRRTGGTTHIGTSERGPRRSRMAALHYCDQYKNIRNISSCAHKQPSSSLGEQRRS